MILLVKKGIGFALTEPEEPKLVEKEKVIPQMKMKKCEMAKRHYDDKKDKFDADKVTVFLLLIGQCYGTMKNKIESDESFDKIENVCDVWGLLQLIKKFSHANEETKCEYWTMVYEVKNVIGIKQFENETIVSYYKRLVNMVKVTESKWGLILLTKMAEDDIDYASKPKEIKNAVRDKFLACVFLSGLRKKKFSKCLDDLNNSFLARQNKYPIDMEAALNYVSGYAHEFERGKDEKNGVTDHVAFAQAVVGDDGRVFLKIKCRKCGKMGRCANHYSSDNAVEEGVNALKHHSLECMSVPSNLSVKA